MIIALLVAIVAFGLYANSNEPDEKTSLSDNDKNSSEGGSKKGSGDSGEKPADPNKDDPPAKPDPGHILTDPQAPVAPGEMSAASGDTGSVEPPAHTTTPTGYTLPRRHKIARNENYTKLAQKYYGSDQWRFVKHIMNANPDINDRALQINTSVKIPALTPELARRLAGRTASPTVAETPAETTDRDGRVDLSLYRIYIVRQNDNLTVIAKEQLGDAKKMNWLYELNKRLGLITGNKNSIKKGQELVLGLR